MLSLLCGTTAGLIHLGCVAAAWAYNLGLKSTPFSWLPYALAFGGLPVFVVMAEPGAGAPAAWLPLAGALLGVGAHLVNTLPDLDDDEATGVRGLPHRLGPRRTRVLAVVTLCGASLVIVARRRLGADAAAGRGAGSGRGPRTGGSRRPADRTPFRAAIGIALADAVLLVAAR